MAIAFAFRSARSAAALERQFPPALARPAGAIAAWLVRHREAERELADLRQADAERRRFVSVVAHGLRTPLASLGGYLDLVTSAQNRPVPAGSDVDRSPQEPSDGHVPDGEFLGRARDLVAGMATLVADLLELSRLDAGQLHLSPSPFSGAEAAQGAVHDLTPLAIERGIALETALPSRLRTIHADRRRVQQILVNLLGNAIKFSPPSSRVALSLRFDGPVAVYTVRDQGPGVPPDERALISSPSIVPRARNGSWERGSGCRSRATWRAEWEGTSTWHPRRIRVRRSWSRCPPATAWHRRSWRPRLRKRSRGKRPARSTRARDRNASPAHLSTSGTVRRPGSPDLSTIGRRSRSSWISRFNSRSPRAKTRGCTGGRVR